MEEAALEEAEQKCLADRTPGSDPRDPHRSRLRRSTGDRTHHLSFGRMVFIKARPMLVIPLPDHRAR
jgi:hypothetical protein